MQLNNFHLLFHSFSVVSCGSQLDQLGVNCSQVLDKLKQTREVRSGRGGTVADLRPWFCRHCF